MAGRRCVHAAVAVRKDDELPALPEFPPVIGEKGVNLTGIATPRKLRCAAFARKNNCIFPLTQNSNFVIFPTTF